MLVTDDVVRIEIDRIGAIENRVVQGQMTAGTTLVSVAAGT